jgi:hypothetical protein
MMAASFLSLVTGLSVDQKTTFTGCLDLRYGHVRLLLHVFDAALPNTDPALYLDSPAGAA